MTMTIKGTGLEQSNFGQGIGGTGPAFSAYQTGAQNTNTATMTSMALNVEDYDLGGFYNNTAAIVNGIPPYAFMPNIAGYYQISGRCQFVSNVAPLGSEFLVSVGKNGSSAKRGNSVSGINASASYSPSVSALIYLNGTTDYVQLFAYQSTGSVIGLTVSAPDLTNFSGFLARAS